jgi:hypothetical protein
MAGKRERYRDLDCQPCLWLVAVNGACQNREATRGLSVRFWPILLQNWLEGSDEP